MGYCITVDVVVSMTKQEQIAEIANDIAKCCPDKVDDGCFDKQMNCVSCIAMELYKKGYRKIPKNAVVLTIEEYRLIAELCRRTNRETRKKRRKRY